MDGSRFDHLARSLAATRSRRSALGALAGAALASLGLAAASARTCRLVGNTCAANGDCCSGNCVTEGRTRKICRCSSPADCPAGDQCHTATCTGGQCGLQVTADATCDDGDPCTTGDVCQANGTCAGTPKNCDDGNACLASSCDPVSGQCVRTSISCDDGDDCTIDSCDPYSGCMHTPVACPPALNECFTAGTCQNGACSDPVYRGDQAPCSVGVCHANVCCMPEPKATTCTERCASQTNNCGQTVDCGAVNGASCASAGDCCSGLCDSGTCGVATGGSCALDNDCVSQHCCGGICRDLDADASNCGACGHACRFSETCSAGSCLCGAGPSCPEDQACVSGACTADCTQFDCATLCGTDAYCFHGTDQNFCFTGGGGADCTQNCTHDSDCSTGYICGISFAGDSFAGGCGGSGDYCAFALGVCPAPPV
jgi:hypothetical protein